jgi:enoyl-CoA hydratase
MAYTNLAIIPDIGGTFRPPRLVGLAAARKLILTGERIDAKRALEIGMISRVVPPEQLMDKTMQFAEKLAKRAPVALAMAKSAINKSLSSDLSTALQLESYIQTICFQCQDVIEAATAMFEKRELDFKGK